MRYQLELFLTALGFFTRIPVPAWVPWSPERLNHAARYFPLVGWVVGGVGAGAFLALALVLPVSLAVILSMAVTIRLTGAFHEDGLADTFDALGGHVSRERALQIMRDSRIGTYGAAALAFDLLLRWQAIALDASAEPGGLAGRLRLPEAFARAVHDALAPGATVIVTDEPLGIGVSDLTVLEAGDGRE